MDFPDSGNDMKLAMEKVEAQTRLLSAPTPDRLNEDWRFGRPHKHAAALAELLADSKNNPSRGSVTIEDASGCADHIDKEDADCELLMSTIGSDRLLGLHLQRFGKGAALFIEGQIAEPITITYETDSLFTPTTLIIAAPGAAARIRERHITRGEGCMVCTRIIQAAEGAELAIELEECGSGSSRAMNITNISAVQAKVRHITTHSNHAWAREETIAEVLHSEGDADIRLYSHNRLSGDQVLDQHTRQIHTAGRSTSDLLYKNVVEDNATAIFAGNIYVGPGAHDTDAYQSNRNMMLSEKATIHSLPGLEILADRVRCSHGSASAPMDEEQLFYLLSRGIPRRDAQQLVAEGFLADAVDRFHSSSDNND